MQNWYSEIFRKVHLDWHQPPWMRDVASGLDPASARAMAALLHDAGAEAVGIFVHDHHGFCLFPDARAGRSHPGLQSDYVGLMLDSLHEAGMKAIAYMNVYSNIFLATEHPDWAVVSPGVGRPSGAWLQFPASHMCPSSPYLEEYFLPLLREALGRFPFDGLWLDGGSWLTSVLCACDHCSRRFKEETGHDLPESWPDLKRRSSPVLSWRWESAPTKQYWALSDDETEDATWFAWRTWRTDQVVRYLTAATELAKSVRPTILVADNNAGRWLMPLAVRADNRVRWLTPRELPVDYLSCDPVPNGGNHEVTLSREGRYHATTGVPFDYMNVRSHRWGEWQLRSPVDFKLEFATILAVGGRCFFADQPYPDGTLENAVYRSLTDGYTFVAEREDLVRDARVAPDIAILASAPSQLFGPIGNGVNPARLEHGLIGSATASRTDRVEGAHLAATELGLHTLLYDEATLRANLSAQTAVVVPEQCLLEAETIEALRGYVTGGGRLLVTGRTGWWDEQHCRRDPTGLYELLGVEPRGLLPAPIHYLRFTEAFETSRYELPDIPLQCWGTGVDVAATNAEAVAWLSPPRPEVWANGIVNEEHWRHYTTVGACPPSVDRVAPAVTIRSVGAGYAAYVAVDPFAVYRHEGHHLMRMFLGALFELVAPPRLRRVAIANKPYGVEVSLQRCDRRLVVHLVNYFAQKSSGLSVQNEQVLPVRDLVVRVRAVQAPKTVVMQPHVSGFEWTYDVGEKLVEARIPQLDIHCMVVLEEELQG